MTITKYFFMLASLGMLFGPAAAQEQQPMSFFVTSEPIGDGGNLGGLAGADAHCQSLAAVGRGDDGTTWRAYLSQAPINGLPQVNARDRIGDGPWYNADSVYIAMNIDDLHEDRNNVRKYTALDENGNEVNGRGDQPNRHDILTGSDSMGRLAQGDAADTTCSNYTSNSDGTSYSGTTTGWVVPMLHGMLRIVVDPVAMKISGLLVAMGSYTASQSTEIE